MAHCRVQRRKHARIRQHFGPREPVEQSGLARVGISHQRHGRQRYGLPLLALCSASPANVLQGIAKFLDAAVNSAAIGFELRFAGTSGSDAASLPGHPDAASSQARQHVI